MKDNNEAKVLFVAAGGGGDALMSVMLAEQLGFKEAYFATLAWERKIFDPEPGPRTAMDFSGLKRFGNNNWLVSKVSQLKSGALTFLPQLSKALQIEFFLLDLTWGAPGVRKQLEELLDLLKPTKVYIVDAGGDIIAEGNEPGLKSPLADSIVLAGAHNLKPETKLILCALSLDGELEKRYLLSILDKLSGDRSLTVNGKLTSEKVVSYLPLFYWFPSEVTGLACLSAMGYRGLAEIRDQGYAVELDEESSDIYLIEAKAAFQNNKLAQAVEKEHGLEKADAVIKKLTGRSELEYERQKAVKLFAHKEPSVYNSVEEIHKLLQYSNEAKKKGIAYLTIRRVGEALSLSYPNLEKLKAELESHFPERYRPPIWIC